MKLSLVRVYQAVWLPGKNKPLTTIQLSDLAGLELTFEGGLVKIQVPSKPARFVPTPNIMWMDEMPEAPAPAKVKGAK